MGKVLDELFDAMLTPGTLVHEGFKQVYGDPLNPPRLRYGTGPFSVEGTAPMTPSDPEGDA